MTTKTTKNTKNTKIEYHTGNFLCDLCALCGEKPPTHTTATDNGPRTTDVFRALTSRKAWGIKLTSFHVTTARKLAVCRFCNGVTLRLKVNRSMAEKTSRLLLTADEIDDTLDQMASSIYGEVVDKNDLVLVGIRTGGVYIANRLHDKIRTKAGREVPVGILDIGLYRDDWTRLSTNPILRSTEMPVSIDDRVVVLVDDVLFTGRTVRAAMDALIDFGRPKRIELAVLIDRGHRELPICANYVGINVSTTLDEVVNVYMSEAGEEDKVVVEPK